LHDRVRSPVKIHFADNPPLFAWVEWEYAKLTGDLGRLRWVTQERQYLQKHFAFMEQASRLPRNPAVRVAPCARREPLGYTWRGNTSGMDNIPRGRSWWNATRLNPRGQIYHNGIYWLDLLAMQALSAEAISSIALLIGDIATAETYEHKRGEHQALLNHHYWDDADGVYYDLRKPRRFASKAVPRDPPHNRVMTTATYWPMLAGLCSPAQAARLLAKARDPAHFGGERPWPALSRSDRDYDPRGRYWRGGVWIPEAYMGTKALERYHYFGEADEQATSTLLHVLRTYQDFEPHTLWEVYSPAADAPATQKKNECLAKGPFCGWTALAPISMFLENYLGFHEINALTNTIRWRIHQPGRHGIRGLRFGGTTTSLVAEAGTIEVESTAPYQLLLTDDRGRVLEEIAVGTGKTRTKVSTE
jgi:hypothetical protein